MTDPKPDTAEAASLAAIAGITIPDAFLPGIANNIALLREYAALVHGLTLPDSVEPAPEYVP